jgi:hypothetical protein
MARFDWLRFLKQHRIEFVTDGPNFARGNVANIKCPWCGENDPSQHMGIGPKGWGCLRNAGHRGKSPAWLVQRLLGCSLEEAKRVTGSAADLAPTLDEFAASANALRRLSGVEVQTRAKKLALLPEFKPLLSGSVFAKPFLDYLRARGYRDAQIKWLAENYKLHYATKGRFAYRIIIPIYDRFGQLLSWTGRTIVPEQQPRYKTLRMEPDERDPHGPVALLASNHTLLGLPVLWGASNPRVLILVEGPFDALKLTAFGHSLGLYGASLFGLNVYTEQVAIVEELSRRFDRTYLLIDEDAVFQRLRLLNKLATVNVHPLKMPANSDDPGAMRGEQVVELALTLVAA